MKKYLFMLITVFLLPIFFVYVNNQKGAFEILLGGSNYEDNSVELNIDNATDLICHTFSDPFFDVMEGEEKLEESKVQAIISNIPSDKYEEYHNGILVPTKAILYKDNEATLIDIRDPRLIKLINFYNNTLYAGQYSYTQGTLDSADLECINKESCRLVVVYSYANNLNRASYDTIVVTNKWFVTINHNFSANNCPGALAFGYVPLHYYYRWLDLFDF